MDKLSLVLDIIGASLLATVAFSYKIIFGVAVAVWSLSAMLRIYMLGRDDGVLEEPRD